MNGALPNRSQPQASPATPWPGWVRLFARRAVLPGSRQMVFSGRDRHRGRCPVPEPRPRHRAELREPRAVCRDATGLQRCRACAGKAGSRLTLQRPYNYVDIGLCGHRAGGQLGGVRAAFGQLRSDPGGAAVDRREPGDCRFHSTGRWVRTHSEYGASHVSPATTKAFDLPPQRSASPSCPDTPTNCWASDTASCTQEHTPRSSPCERSKTRWPRCSPPALQPSSRA